MVLELLKNPLFKSVQGTDLNFMSFDMARLLTFASFKQQSLAVGASVMCFAGGVHITLKANLDSCSPINLAVFTAATDKQHACMLCPVRTSILMWIRPEASGKVISTLFPELVPTMAELSQCSLLRFGLLT